MKTIIHRTINNGHKRNNYTNSHKGAMRLDGELLSTCSIKKVAFPSWTKVIYWNCD